MSSTTPRTTARGNTRAGRGGRGRGNKPRTTAKPLSTKFKGNCEKLHGAIFDCSDYKQADNFVSSLKRISEYVGSEYQHGGDIRSSIINQARFVVVIPTRPIIADEDLPTADEKVLLLIFQGKISAYIKRDELLLDNIQKAYSLILGQCTDLLQSKMKQQTTWAAISAAQDAIGLIALIKSITFKFEDQKFLPLALYQAKANLYNLRQGLMSNHDYLQRFNNLVDVALTYNGQLHDQAIVDIVTEKLHPGTDYEDATDAQKIIIQAAAADLYLATMFIYQSDRKRFGKLSEDLENSFTKGNNDYPDNLVSAYHLINEYKNFQPKTSVPSPTGVAFSQKSDKTDKSLEAWKKKQNCHHCGVKGHTRPDCPRKDEIIEEDTDSTATASKKPAAKPIPKKKTVRKAITFTTKDEPEEEEVEDSYLNYGFCTTTSDGIKLRNMILLDSQSTVDLFCNPKMVARTWTCDESITVRGNGGSLTTKTKALLRNYGEIWFDNRAITNILSLKNVREKYRVTFDSNGSNAFVVHKPKGVNLRFEMHRDGLYYHDPLKHHLTLVNTVKDAEEGFSSRQIQQAKLAREFQAVVGNPSTKDLKAILASNQIANCPVTVEDVDRAEIIYGPSVLILKGKTTRRSPEQVVSDYVLVPQKLLDANSNVVLSGDIFFINTIPFLVTVADNIKFTTTELLQSRKIPNILAALRHVQALYHKRGFKITELRMDGEFAPLRHDLASIGINLNITAANEHVPQVERQIRVIKERVRAIRHSLPFKYLPSLLLVELTYFSTMWLNAFPPRGGVSQNVSPRGIVTGTQFDYVKHCKLPFGSYVQAHEEPDKTNTQGARTVGAICLGPTGNLQGSYKFYNLRSGRLITRRNWTAIPMPQEVIDRVDALGKADKQPPLLTFFDRRGLLIGDLPSPAGINDSQDAFDLGDGLDPPTVNDDYGLDDAPDLVPIPPDHLEDPVAHDTFSPTIGEQDNLFPDSAPPYDAPHPDPALQVAPTTDTSIEGVSTRSRPTRVRNKPSAYIPSFKGQTYKALTTIQDAHSFFTFPDSFPDSHLNSHFALVSSYSMTQLSMQAGLKRWKQAGEDAITSELKQLHFRDTFLPVNPKNLSKQDFDNVLESHLFLKQKRDDTIKGRMVAGGNKQRGFISPDEASSPTASLEAVLLTSILDALEERDVAIIDIPNAFVQTRITDDADKAIIRMRGKLAELLVSVSPSMYSKYITVNSKGQKILYVRLLNALYGIMKAALLFYKRLVGDLESIGFILNPYDPCVANKTVDGTPLTVVWHVDDLKISHKSPKTVSRMITWLKKTYERLFNDGSGSMKICRGKLHNYLGMALDFQVQGQVSVRMVSYVEEIVSQFKTHDDNNKVSSTPAAEHIFRVDDESPKLPEEKSIIFHHFVAKCLFLTKRSRPDIAVAVAFLTTRVQTSDEDDWKKLIRLIRYLRGTTQLSLTLRATSAIIPKWWVDGSHGVHPTMRGHTGGCLSLGRGMQNSTSTKQKMNSRSSTETEIIAVDDLMPSILWTNYFLEHQGYGSKNSILFQDNQSAILLETNGRKSSGKRTKHINMRFYFITDRIRNNEVSVKYCPTQEMVADFFTKPLQGKSFIKFRAIIMNLPDDTTFNNAISKECVGTIS